MVLRLRLLYSFRKLLCKVVIWLFDGMLMVICVWNIFVLVCIVW